MARGLLAYVGMMPTPVLLRAVAIAGGLSLAIAGGVASYNAIAGARPVSQGSMKPVAFTDATGTHRLVEDTGAGAAVTLHEHATGAGEAVTASTTSTTAAPDAAAASAEASEAVTPAAGASAEPPVMTAPEEANAAAAAVPPPAPPAVTIVRMAPAPAVAAASLREDVQRQARADREDEHAARGAKRHGRGGGD